MKFCYLVWCPEFCWAWSYLLNKYVAKCELYFVNGNHMVSIYMIRIELYVPFLTHRYARIAIIPIQRDESFIVLIFWSDVSNPFDNFQNTATHHCVLILERFSVWEFWVMENTMRPKLIIVHQDNNVKTLVVMSCIWWLFFEFKLIMLMTV